MKKKSYTQKIHEQENWKLNIWNDNDYVDDNDNNDDEISDGSRQDALSPETMFIALILWSSKA